MSLLGAVVFAAPPEKLDVFQTRVNFEGLDEEIYPLGWAKGGEHLALLRAHPNEAADVRLWEVQVIDLVNDKLVLNEEIRHLAEGGLAAFWTDHGAKVEGFLKVHGVSAASFRLHRFPALLGKFRGGSYEAGLERTYATEPNFEYRGLTKLKLTLSSSTGESKTVFEESWKEWFPMAAGVLGYLPNPDGSRMAILMGTTYRGYEGPPHARDVVVVGARVGF